MIRQISVSEFQLLMEKTKLVKELVLPPKVKLPRNMQGVCFEQVDFNYPILGGFLNKPILRKCKFVECNLDGINAEKTLFEDCVFTKVVFGSKSIGSINNCRFVNCSFYDCQFANIKFSSGFFDNCSFENCKLTKINLNNCTLNYVKFTGVFISVNWVDCNTNAVDVSSVNMKDVSLTNTDHYDIKLPNNKENFLVYGSDFEQIKAELKNKISLKTFDDFCYLAEFVFKYPNGIIVDKDFFSEASGVEKKTIMELLYSQRINAGEDSVE